MKATIKRVIEECMANCYQDTSMALDIICETLFCRHGIDAKWQGRSVYIGEDRVASIDTCREGKGIVAIWRYTIIEGK